MDRAEFGQVMAYLSAATGKPVAREQAEVYFDLLGDLPAAALRAAAQRALLESRYPTVPPVGELRRLAVEALAGMEGLPTPAEAWGVVRAAVSAYGYFRQEEGLASLPRTIRRAVECLGWQEICDSTEPEIVRAQFSKAYEAIAGREQRERLLPAPLRQALAEIGRAGAGPLESPAAVGKLLGRIGKEPEEA